MTPEAAATRRLRLQRSDLLRWLAASPAVVLLVVALFVPAFLTLRAATEVDASQWLDLITRRSPDGAAVFRTVTISLQVTAVTLLLAYPYAFALTVVGPWVRRALFAAMLLPFFTSLLIRSYAWTQVLSPAGPIASFLEAIGLSPAPALVYNRTGVVIGMTHILMPMAVLPLYAVLQSLPRNLPRAARTLGATRVRSFFEVTLPLSIAGAAAGGVIVFIQSLGFFVTPALLGGRRDAMAAQAIDQQMRSLADTAGAAAIAVILVSSVVGLVVGFRFFYPVENLFLPPEHRTHSRRASTRGSPNRRRQRLGDILRPATRWVVAVLDAVPWRGVLAVTTGLLAVFFLVPLIGVFPLAFTAEPFLRWLPQAYGVGWFVEVVTDPGWRAAAWNSLLVGGAATALSVLVGTPVAFAVVRTRQGNILRRSILLGSALPAIVPIVVTALGTFLAFLQLGLLSNRLALAAVHGVLGLPFVVYSVLGALRNFNPRLEQAARSLGASHIRTMREVTLPLLAPAIAAGALFAFIISLDELLIARAVLRSAQIETLAMKIWVGANEELSPALAVVSVLQIGLTVIALVLAVALLRQQKMRASRTA